MASNRRTLWAGALATVAAQAVALSAPNASFVPELQIDLADPHVFSPEFYLYNQADLLPAGVITAEAARQHWLTSGIVEGRQASGQFHAKQYLDRYPDLRAAFGNDYRAAVQHYLTTGLNERRLGFNEGEAYGRWTIADVELGLYLSTSRRMAGAIDSLVYDGHEFINARDHGRELQIAITANGHGECYNPTEAGSSDDSAKPTSTSVLQGVDSSGNVLRTTVLPAFWLGPGEPELQPSSFCQRGVSTNPVSLYSTSKAVSFRPFGIPGAIQFQFSIKLPEPVTELTIEGPTGYMTQPFTSYFTIDVHSGALTPLSHDIGEQPYPVVFATPDGSKAMGAYSPPSQGQVAYARFDFSTLGTFIDATNKWNIAFRRGNYPAGYTVSMVTYMCVGSLPSVQACMRQVAAHTGEAVTIV